MTKKKNRFLTFVFSLIPGAGLMYMGFMKRGISLMSMFFAGVMLAGWIRADIFMLASVVIWFYSFFYVHNLYALPDEKFDIEEDGLLLPFIGEESEIYLQISNSRLRTAGAIVLILAGAGLLWNFLLDLIGEIIYPFLPEEMYHAFWNFCYGIPEVVIAILVIWLGIRLIKGKKKELIQQKCNEEVMPVQSEEQ